MENKRGVITKASYIDSDYDEFERVSLAFQIGGFAPLQEEVVNGKGTGGGFIMNLIDPYLASKDLTEEEAFILIHYGLDHDLATLQRELTYPELRPTFILIQRSEW